MGGYGVAWIGREEVLEYADGGLGATDLGEDDTILLQQGRRGVRRGFVYARLQGTQHIVQCKQPCDPCPLADGLRQTEIAFRGLLLHQADTGLQNLAEKRVLSVQDPEGSNGCGLGLDLVFCELQRPFRLSQSVLPASRGA